METEEIENLVPKISPTCFQKNESARYLDSPENAIDAMFKLRGSWNVIGWAHSLDVAPKDLCKHVVLFWNSESSQRVWRHATRYMMADVAQAAKQNPSKVVSFR